MSEGSDVLHGSVFVLGCFCPTYICISVYVYTFTCVIRLGFVCGYAFEYLCEYIYIYKYYGSHRGQCVDTPLLALEPR